MHYSIKSIPYHRYPMLLYELDCVYKWAIQFIIWEVEREMNGSELAEICECECAPSPPGRLHFITMHRFLFRLIFVLIT